MRWRAIGKCLAAGRDLHQQRIVKRRDHRAGIAHAAIEPDAEARRGAVGEDFAVARHELVFRILGGDAALHGETVARDRLLRREGEFRAVERRAVGNENLGAHEIDAGDDLGDRVLHLDARDSSR